MQIIPAEGRVGRGPMARSSCDYGIVTIYCVVTLCHRVGKGVFITSSYLQSAGVGAVFRTSSFSYSGRRAASTYNGPDYRAMHIHYTMRILQTQLCLIALPHQVCAPRRARLDCAPLARMRLALLNSYFLPSLLSSLSVPPSSCRLRGGAPQGFISVCLSHCLLPKDNKNHKA